MFPVGLGSTNEHIHNRLQERCKSWVLSAGGRTTIRPALRQQQRYNCSTRTTTKHLSFLPTLGIVTATAVYFVWACLRSFPQVTHQSRSHFQCTSFKIKHHVVEHSSCHTTYGEDVRRQHFHPLTDSNLALTCLNPFRTPVPFWGQTSQVPSSLSPIVPKNETGVLKGLTDPKLLPGTW